MEQQQQEQQQQSQPQQNQPNEPDNTAAEVTVAAVATGNGVPAANAEEVPIGVLAPSSSVPQHALTGRRPRGRPRKYATDEEAAAAKKSRAAERSSSNAGRNIIASNGDNVRLNHINGNAGHSFNMHTLMIAEGENIGQNIMTFMQQSGHEICIISATGKISDASIIQSATPGGSMTYQGSFEIIKLNGSYVRTERGRTGGLSVTLSSPNGQVFGGSVGGLLTAGSPVQVTIATFINGSSNITPVGTPRRGVPVSSTGFPSSLQSAEDSHPATSMHATPSRPSCPGAQQFTDEEEEEEEDEDEDEEEEGEYEETAD